LIEKRKKQSKRTNNFKSSQKTANSKIEDAVYPFELYFIDAINKTKEEMIERKFNSQNKNPLSYSMIQGAMAAD
jgi:hypothetical protein